jgi:hypothetical protein
VAMIAFAAFIVITQNAFPFDHKRQPVFEGMGASGNRLRQMLQDNLEEGRFIDHFAGFLDQYGVCVVIHDNVLACCQ